MATDYYKNECERLSLELAYKQGELDGVYNTLSILFQDCPMGICEAVLTIERKGTHGTCDNPEE